MASGSEAVGAATMAPVGGSGDPVSPQACGRSVAVFDGRMRFDLQSEFKRMEMVKAEKGYQGPAVVCAVYFKPISGYVPERYAIKYLAALHDAEVWLAPLDSPANSSSVISSSERRMARFTRCQARPTRQLASMQQWLSLPAHSVSAIGPSSASKICAALISIAGRASR